MRRYAVRLGNQTFTIGPGAYRLGRARTCDIRIDDAAVSRHHATLRIEEERAILIESGSRNGVRVNGERHRGSIEIHPGDVLQLGATEMVVEREDEALPLAVTRPMEPERTTDMRLSALSPREHEVFLRIARGATQREVAEELGLSIKTVETYRSRVADKLGTRTRAEMVAVALETGALT